MDAPEENNPATKTQPAMVTGWKKGAFAVAAGFFFLLGMLGVILPALPTTPFLLLTSYFLVRCSPKLNAALLRSRFIGPILTDWQDKRGVRPDIKVKAIAGVVIAIALSIYFAGNSVPVATAILLLAAIGIYVIVRLPVIKP